MVRGLEVFREYFRDYTDQYVIIGGCACDLLFDEAGLEFRATKDIDMVLIIEALTPEFGESFWNFIHRGGYRHINTTTDTPQYYRFDKPTDTNFPVMIELFSRTNVLTIPPTTPIIPIHIDDSLSSLSAILLDEDYYQLLINGRYTVDGTMILMPEALIALKAKAFLDFKKRGEEKKAKKHLKDVIRLAELLSGSERPDLPESVKKDMESFMEQYSDSSHDPSQLKVTITREVFTSLMHNIFQL